MPTRISIDGLSRTQLRSIGTAYATSQSTPDERGYHHFAGMHGLPVPSFCPHGNLYFLPWHRAYLYFLELELQHTDPDVAIPWWDWLSPASQRSGIPRAYSTPTLSGRPNPLFNVEFDWDRNLIAQVRRNRRLGNVIMTGGTSPRTRRSPDAPSELPRSTTIQSILNSPTFEDFSGRLENVHGAVHVWVGGSMSSVVSAAYDPIFWSHHAMIDRLWYLWQNSGRGVNPPASMLDDPLSPFPVTVRDMLNIDRLGYEYAVQEVSNGL